ncbi:MAG: beta-glucosidase BglX [Paludibacter sp.]|nr:beta-glucosidase BglX [Paludibacter sp.]
MKRLNLAIVLLIFCVLVSAQKSTKATKSSKSVKEVPAYKNPRLAISERIADLISRMTIEEKAGQLNQISSGSLTGPSTKDEGDVKKIEQIRNGEIGSFLNLTGSKNTYDVQKIAVEETRLGIPLLFALDVIHGYKTIFPIPLAEACSWDLEEIENNQRVAAAEASSAGIHWTFAPMCDISADPRWGRVMEGAGEDPFLGALIAAARVRGFQGDLTDGKHIMACVKHFAAYGAVEAGREYNHVDISRYALWNKYLPPYKAGIDAGAATVMNSFNVFEGVPATANKYLNVDVLKHKLGFKGFTISDWNTYSEMIFHGYASDEKDCLEKAMNGGGMVEMSSQTTIKYLPELVAEGKISMAQVDEAVSKILYYKFKLGLFEQPYRYCDEQREKNELFSMQNRAVARKSAGNSIILLKNENNILPLKPTTKVALIGYYAKSKVDMFDFWTAKGEYQQAVSILEGLSTKFPNLIYSDGYKADATTTDSLINRALEAAKNADVLLVNIGLSGALSGEDRSLANIKIPAGQLELLKALKKTGKPIVALISSGRPMVLTQIQDISNVLLQCWVLGSETGNAVADVVSGLVNPSAKTVMSFPVDEGQIPVYYNHFNTGRPLPEVQGGDWFSRYRDIPNQPLYPFGYGLSYTQFAYSNVGVNRTTFSKSDTIIVKVNLKNIGKLDGLEIVQLYIQDPVASLVRPIKELKGYQKVALKQGEEKIVKFKLTANELGFYSSEGNWTIEPGEFKIMVGTNSDNVSSTVVRLVDK